MSKICWCGCEKLDEYNDNYFVCKRCKTLISKNVFDASIFAVKNEERDLYGENYWKKVMIETTGETDLDSVVDHYYKDRVPYWIHYLLKYTDISYKAAEIGCGLGQLAQAMRALGYSQTAFELSPSICDYIRNNQKVNIVCGDFEKEASVYDLIVGMDVFEHMIDPVGVAKSLYSHLSDRGVLCLQTPCYEPRYQYHQLAGEYTRFKQLLIPEQHVFLFSKESIKQLLTECGFREVVFEPAVFGDEYDMFLFASKGQLSPVDDDEINRRYGTDAIGRSLKAAYGLMTDLKFYQEECKKRLEVINVLDNAVKSFQQS